MMIKARMGISADGFVATPDGLPALLAMPEFVPGVCRTATPSSSTAATPC
jgi:hypothetical protein